MDTKKILIAEDDKLLSTIFKMFLKELGYNLVGIVVEGNDAISKCKELEPDVILMDIHLKGELNGIETTRIIQENLNVPVIFISHDTREETIRSAIRNQSYGFLAKPIDISSLGVSIELAYHRHKNKQVENIKEHLYKTLIENSPDAVVVLFDEKIEYLNHSAFELLNIDAKKGEVAYNIKDVFKEKASSEILSKINEATLSNKKINETEITIPGDEEDIFIKLFGSIIEFEGQNIVQLVLREN